MSDHVYKIAELVGSSSKSIDHAIQNAVTRASKTLRNLDWFEVVATRGQIQDSKVAHFQVTPGYTEDRFPAGCLIGGAGTFGSPVGG